MNDRPREDVVAQVLELARDQASKARGALHDLAFDGEASLDLSLRDDLKLDSIQLVALAVEVEDHFEICLDEEDEDRIVTLRDLAEVVGRKLGPGSPESTGRGVDVESCP